MEKLDMKEAVTVICYDEIEHWNTRKEALDFYNEAIDNSDGIEQQRYLNIVDQLEAGMKIALDYGGDAY